MKRIFFVLLAVTAIISSIIVLLSLARAGEDAKGGRIVAYYFHGTFRCPTCHKLEQYSKEAIEENFKDALSSGKLEFKVVNTDERGNEHYIDDYHLYTKSLVLSLLKNGKEIKSKNLTKIWEYVRDKQRFFDYVSEEVSNLLKEAK